MTNDILIIHPTSTAQWHSLLLEAQHALECALSETIEHYLVLLLNRYLQDTEWLNHALGVEYLEAVAQNQRHGIQAVGDQCLLILSFYPERIVKRNLSPEYYFSLGQEAYERLSLETFENQSSTFLELSQSFSEVFNVMRVAAGRTDSAGSNAFLLNQIGMSN